MEGVQRTGALITQLPCSAAFTDSLFCRKYFGRLPCIPVVAWRMVTMTQVVRKSQAGAESDEALLEAIAARKDRDAYEQLFQRHQQAVFSLAHQITGSKHMAEEAAQEALL